MKQQNVYHGSPVQGLKRIEVRDSMDNGKKVYAAKNLVVAAMFIGRAGGDFTCSIGSEDTPYVCERFEGALSSRYNLSGSIYELNSGNFSSNKNLWGEEVTSSKDESVLNEIILDSASNFLHGLQKEGKLNIYKYPSRPDHIPSDDSDLVKRAIDWHSWGGERIIKEFEKYHPQLIHKVREGLGKKV